jgi:hypothetical protein
MALQMPYNFKSVDFPQAYFKVNFVEQLGDGLLLFAAEIFPSAALRENNRCLLEVVANRVPDNADEPDKVKVIYDYLKVQPEYVNATDA